MIFPGAGEHEDPWACHDQFEEMRVVPEEVLKGVTNEEPHGKIFSGKSITSP